MVDILIPTMHSAHRLDAVVANIYETAGYPCHVYFIVEADDQETIDKVKTMDESSYIVNDQHRGINHCFNLGYRKTDSEFFMITTDDIVYPMNWLVEGIVELGNKSVLAYSEKQGHGWGFFLVRRKYIQKQSGVVDEPDTVYHEYTHGYADSEFQHTARMRNEIVYSKLTLDHQDVRFFGARYLDDDGEEKVLTKTIYIRDTMIPYSNVITNVVLHPDCPKERMIKVDIVPMNPIIVDKNRAIVPNKSIENMKIDEAIFQSRAHMWGGETIETIRKAEDCMVLL